MADKKKYEKGTIGWFREQQKLKAKRYGFDNIEDWLKWKEDPFNIVEKNYGKEFAIWARENKNKVQDKLIKAGCKTEKEYQNKCARNTGFKDSNERRKEWRYDTGVNLPKEFNEDCSLWFGEYISQNYVMNTFEDPIKMPPGNPGFDWICKKGQKVDHKGVSSKILFHEYPESDKQLKLSKIKLWKGHLWSRSYCLLTTGQTTLDILKKYVESQGENETQKVENKCHLCGWE